MHCGTRRLDSLKRNISLAKGEFFLVTDPVNVSWLTGFKGEDSWVLLGTKSSNFLSDFRYWEQAKNELFPDITISVEPQPISGLISLLKGKSGKLLLEDTCSIGLFSKIEELLPNLKLKPCRGQVEKLRQTKDPDEIGLIREACNLSSKILLETIAQTNSGDSDYDLEFRIKSLFLQAQAQAAFEPIVALGNASAQPHAQPDGSRVVPGKIILIDLGARLNSYCSDLTRTYVFEKFPPHFIQRYQSVLDAQSAAREAVFPGKLGREIDAAAREILDRDGLGDYFGHALGHGVGRQVHEAPSVSAQSEQILKEGMVITIEPGIYLPGWGGIRVEDTVLVTSDGCEVLTSPPKHLDSILLA